MLDSHYLPAFVSREIMKCWSGVSGSGLSVTRHTTENWFSTQSDIFQSVTLSYPHTHCHIAQLATQGVTFVSRTHYRFSSMSPWSLMKDVSNMRVEREKLVIYLYPLCGVCACSLQITDTLSTTKWYNSDRELIYNIGE